MKTRHSKAARRLILKSLAASGGGVIASKAIPKSWTRPVIDSVLLPAHASTSNVNEDAQANSAAEANPCVGESRTIGADERFINIFYDGVSPPTFHIETFDDSLSLRYLLLRVSDTPSFSVGRIDWVRTTPERNVADGIYTRTATHIVSGDEYEIVFCIATAGEDASRTLTLTLVSFRKL